MRDDNFHGRLTTASWSRNANKPCPATANPSPVPGARVSPLSHRATWRVYSLELGSHAPQQQNILQSPENVFPRIKFILSHHRFRFVFRKPFHATFSQRIKRFVNNLVEILRISLVRSVENWIQVRYVLVQYWKYSLDEGRKCVTFYKYDFEGSTC